MAGSAAAASPAPPPGPCNPAGAEDHNGQESLQQDVSPDQADGNAPFKQVDAQSSALWPDGPLEPSYILGSPALQPGTDTDTTAAVALPEAPNVMGVQGTAAGSPDAAVVAVDEATIASVADLHDTAVVAMDESAIPATSATQDTAAFAVDEPISAAAQVSRASGINDSSMPLCKQPKPPEQAAVSVSIDTASRVGEGQSTGTSCAPHRHANGTALRSGRLVTLGAVPAASTELHHRTAGSTSAMQVPWEEARELQADNPRDGKGAVAAAAPEAEGSQLAPGSVPDAAVAGAATAVAVQPRRSGRHRDAAAEPEAASANAEPSAALTTPEPGVNEEGKLPSTGTAADDSAGKPGTKGWPKEPVKGVLGCSKCRFALKGCIRCRKQLQDSQQPPCKGRHGKLKAVKVSPPSQADKRQHGSKKASAQPRGLLRNDKQASTRDQPVTVPVATSRPARAANRGNLTACPLPASRVQPDEEGDAEQLPNRPLPASMEQRKLPSGTQRPSHPHQQLLSQATTSAAVSAELPSSEPCQAAIIGTDATAEPAATASTGAVTASVRRSARHQQPAQDAILPDITEGAAPDTVRRSSRVRKPAVLQCELMTKAQGSKSSPDNAGQPQLAPCTTGGKAASARGVKRTAPEPSVISDSEVDTPSWSTAAAGVAAVKPSARKKPCSRDGRSVLTPIQEAEEAHEQAMPKPESDFVTTRVHTESDIAEHLAGLTPAERRKRRRKTPAQVEAGTPSRHGIEASANPMNLLLAAAQLADADTQVWSWHARY